MSALIKTKDKNLAELAKELIKASVIQTTASDTCWLDKSRCPYGLPEGTFEKRPVTCYPGGCKKLASVDIKEFCRTGIDDEVTEKVNNAFERMGRKLSDEITVIAEEEEKFKISQLERSILIKAVEIMKKREKEQNEPDQETIIKKKDLEEI